MGIKLATRIQHHPSRAALLDDLLPRLAGLDPQVVADPGGPRSSWRTHRLCLEAIPDDATHALIVQDDAMPCAGFAAAVHAATLERPGRIICLFVPGVGHITRRVNIARNKRERWLEFPSTSYVPIVAVVYPADVARRITAFADAKRIPVARADDAVVGAFARANRITACATLPCLVEHRDEVESVMRMPSGNGSPHRLAAWYEQQAVCVSSSTV